MDIANRDIPMDLIELVGVVKNIVESCTDWIKCDSKLTWNKSSFKDGDGKEKSYVQLNYTVESSHPFVRDNKYQVSFKIQRDRTIEMWCGGLTLPFFSVNTYCIMSESEINDIPSKIGRYLDIKTSGLIEHA